MFVEVSIGEAVDKYSILEIKKQKIADPAKLVQVENEFEAMSSCKSYIEKMPAQYKWLTYVNESIWDMTDRVKAMSHADNCQEFAAISNEIFEFNQRRFRAKKMFNTMGGIHEQKSYGATVCVVRVETIDTFYRKLPEVNYLSLAYDYILFECPMDIGDRIYQIYNGSSFIKELAGMTIASLTEYTLLEYTLETEQLREIFDFCPIDYISGGMLGDFIQGLSVVAEHFYATGRRGIVYISETEYGGDTFRNGLENTFCDTYDMISNQAWCKKYRIYDTKIGISNMINLNDWRYTGLTNTTTWHNIYKHSYGVEWGKHRWLTLNKDMIALVENHTCKNKIIINMTHYRFSPSINYQLLVSTYGLESLLFLASNLDDYRYFKEQSGLDIALYSPTNFTDLCVAIASSVLFMGGLSAPLAIAHGLFVRRSICIQNGGTEIGGDDLHNVGNPYWDNEIDFQYMV